MTTSFTTYVYISGSSQRLDKDLAYLQEIVRTVYANHAMVSRNWIEAARSGRQHGVKDSEITWISPLDENIETIKKSHFVIIEASQARFSQGLQAYLAAQYKKPTLIVTRAQIKDRFISGVANKYVSIKQYGTEAELEKIVSKFIKQNAIPEKDLRFNFILSRRIYKYLRDKSYETGKNKSEIIREVLEREIARRDG